MAYPAPFHRIVMIGSLYEDEFNTTLSMVPGLSGTLPAVTQSLADAVATWCGTWFGRNINTGTPYGPGFSSSAKLTSVKVNRIGTDGRYQDPDAIESVLPAPVSGFHTATPPAQLSVAATLRGSAQRALAGKGRMFLPPSSIVVTMDATGRISTTSATQYGNAVGALMAGLNDVYLTAGVNAVAGIASNTRGGAFQAIDQITIGRTVDTIRSRRNKIPEDYITVTTFP